MVDARTVIGGVELPNPVMTASGTSGHGAELEAYFPLQQLGAVVVKSIATEPWAGNPAPRLHETTGGMLNSVGLQGPGVDAWLVERPACVATRWCAASWSASGDERSRSTGRPPRSSHGASDDIVAIELNLSCPNLDGAAHLFAHGVDDTAPAVSAVVAEADRPVWAKLTAHVTDIVEIATSASHAGAARGHRHEHVARHGNRLRRVPLTSSGAGQAGAG